MYYLNDSITSITTKWLSQLLQKVEANKLWSWGEAEKIGKIQNSVKKIVVQIYQTHLHLVRPPAGAPGQKYCDTAILPYFLVDTNVSLLIQSFHFLSLLFDIRQPMIQQ